MISDVEHFFARGCGRCDRFATPDCSARRWSRGLDALRRICREAGLVETAKWGHPCYMHAGRNVAILGAFRGDFRMTFFDAALLGDPQGVLERQGPNTRHPDAIRFTDEARVSELEPVIRACLRAAMDHAEAGARPPKETAEREIPDELQDAMDGDPELAEAFRRLTTGRRNSYVVGLASSARPETRIARIAKFRPKILAGKGANER